MANCENKIKKKKNFVTSTAVNQAFYNVLFGLDFSLKCYDLKTYTLIVVLLIFACIPKGLASMLAKNSKEFGAIKV